MADSGRRRKHTKDSQLVIRLARADRDGFVDLCESLDTSAAREIRRFIREFTELHGGLSEDGPEAPTGKKTGKKKNRSAGKS